MGQGPKRILMVLGGRGKAENRSGNGTGLVEEKEGYVQSIVMGSGIIRTM